MTSASQRYLRRHSNGGNTADVILDGGNKDAAYLINNSDAVTHIESLVRGHIPQANEEDALAIFLAQSLEHENANNLLSVFVSAQDRFSYAR